MNARQSQNDTAMKSTWAVLSLWAACFAAFDLNDAHAGSPSWTNGVAKLPPGTLVQPSTTQVEVTPQTVPSDGTVRVLKVPQSARFNRLLMLGQPRLTSGDVDSVTEMVRANASLFSFAIMATVARVDEQFVLSEVGLGHALNLDGQPTVLDSETAKQLGADLGLIQRQVLTRNETNLVPPNVVVRTTTLMVFDGPGLIAVNGKNVPRTVRHVVWIHPQTGRLAMAVWCLETTDDGEVTVEDSWPIRLIAEKTVGVRPIHVDGDHIFLTVPGERAFALADFPSGLSLSWTDELRAVLSRDRYDEETLQELSAAINAAMKTAMSGSSRN